MGLASYVINFDELLPIITDAINKSTINTTVDNVVLDNTSVTIDTSKIEEILKNMFTSINDSKSINTGIESATNEITKLLTTHNDNLTTNFTSLQQNLQNILTSATSTYALLKDIQQQIKPLGRQIMIGKKLEIPAINQSYTINFKPTKDILLNGISISQTAWNDDDYWDLYVNNIPIFVNIYTKNRGEHKKFERKFPIPANSTIYFNYYNKSSTNKIIWIDFEYIEIATESI